MRQASWEKSKFGAFLYGRLVCFNSSVFLFWPLNGLKAGFLCLVQIKDKKKNQKKIHIHFKEM